MRTKALETTACVAHELSLAAAYGGSIFRQQVFDPAVKEINHEKERVKVQEAAWAKWMAITVPAHLVFTASWLASRSAIVGKRRMFVNKEIRKLVAAKDFFVVGSLATGLVCAATGTYLLKGVAGGATQASAEQPSKMPVDVQKLERFYKVISPIHTALLGGAIATGSLIGEALSAPRGLARLFGRVFR